jgi:hypothetical protein
VGDVRPRHAENPWIAFEVPIGQLRELSVIPFREVVADLA